MGIDLFFYIRAWDQQKKEINISNYVALKGESGSIYSIHNRYVAKGFIYSPEYTYREISKKDLNSQIFQEIAEMNDPCFEQTMEEMPSDMQTGEKLYQVNKREVLLEKWLLNHVDGYISRDEYNYEDYDMYGLENNTINQWYLPEEIDIESREYKRISFDVKDEFALQRAKMIKEYYKVVQILKAKADLDESSIIIYMYYNY